MNLAEVLRIPHYYLAISAAGRKIIAVGAIRDVIKSGIGYTNITEQFEALCVPNFQGVMAHRSELLSVRAPVDIPDVSFMLAHDFGIQIGTTEKIVPFPTANVRFALWQ